MQPRVPCVGGEHAAVGAVAEPRHLHLLHPSAGDYHLEENMQPWVLYQATPVALPQRLALAEPVRCLATLQVGGWGGGLFVLGGGGEESV